MTTPAADIKASEVQKLRQTTGAGLMDCKRALVEAGGDFEKAVRVLREQGIAKSSKRADRAVSEGLVDIWISPDSKQGVILELNCETDFVARNAEFIGLGKTLLAFLKDNPKVDTVAGLPNEAVTLFAAKIGEKIEAKRFARFTVKAGGAVVGYIHPGSKLGVLVQIDSNKTDAVSDSMKDLGRELALQVAGANPLYIDRSEIPAEVLEREKDIAKKQMEGQKKPAEILEKIAVGKLEQFYEAQALLDQPHVRDASGKTKIQDLVDGVARKESSQLKVSRFVRFRVGAD